MLPGGAEHGGELQRVQDGPVLALPTDVRPGHCQGGVAGDEFVDDCVLEQAGDGRQAAADGGWCVFALLQVPQVQLQVRPLRR